MIRIEGTDTAHGSPSGFAGYPRPQANNFDVTHPLINDGDTTSRVQGLGQLYFLAMPVVAVLGGVNANGEQRIDHNYPGYNFNVSDQPFEIEQVGSVGTGSFFFDSLRDHTAYLLHLSYRYSRVIFLNLHSSLGKNVGDHQIEAPGLRVRFEYSGTAY